MIKEEYYILNVLRGLGALLVIFYHFFVFFFLHQSTSAGLLQIEPINLPAPFYLQTIIDFPINIGHLGVSFFFLISGFFIQPSLEKYNSLKTYLIHKIFRLWPSYLFCFSVGLLFVVAFCILRQIPFPYSSGHIFAYLFWVRDILHYPFIDGAVWSLEIQVKFYVFAGLIWILWKKNFVEAICFLTISMSIVIYGLHSLLETKDLSWGYLLILARKDLKYFILILLGTCIYSLYKKQISLQKSLAFCCILLVFFLSPLFLSPDIIKTISYLLGFFIFSYLIIFHAKSRGPKGVFCSFICWVSEISYPLYIGHVLPGYTIMYLMLDHGLDVYLGIFISLLYVFLMANIVHKQIEVFFVKISSKIFLLFREKSPVN